MSADRPRTELTAAGLAAPDREFAPRLAAPDRGLADRPAPPDRDLADRDLAARPAGPARPGRRALAAGTRPASSGRSARRASSPSLAARGGATLLGVAVQLGARPDAGARRPDRPAPRVTAASHEAEIELEAIDPAATVELTAEEIAAIVAEAAIPAGGPTRAAAPSLELAAAWCAPRVTAPGSTAIATAPAGIEWSERSHPLAPALPASPHERRPPRLALVALYLAGSLCCGLLAPWCWSLASCELDGIRRGAVEDRHRGLLAAARLWGAVASWLLIAGFLLALSALARRAIHP